jgi:hypothetical protein
VLPYGLAGARRSHHDIAIPPAARRADMRLAGGVWREEDRALLQKPKREVRDAKQD